MNKLELTEAEKTVIRATAEHRAATMTLTELNQKHETWRWQVAMRLRIPPVRVER